MSRMSTRCATDCEQSVADRTGILLVRLDGVGDAALCIPALEGLRRAFPEAVFGAVCSEANAALFSQRVERIHLFREGEPVSRLHETIRPLRYAKALVATEEVAGYEIARRSGAAERAGFWHRLHKPFKSLWQRAQLTQAVYRPAARPRAPEHEVQTLYRLAVALGASEPAPATAHDLRAWMRVEPSPDARTANGAVGFQISPKWRSAGYTPSAIAAVVSEAFSALGVAEQSTRGVLLSAADDADLASAIQEQLSPAIGARIRLLASLSLPQWIGAIDSLDTLVTPDTGAAHVAGMLGRRVVDVFDPHDFERLCAQWHPWAGSWRSHAKRPLDMTWDAAAYGRFLAAEVQVLRAAPSAVLEQR